MIYDVTLPMSPGMVGWPGDPGVECERFGDHVKISRWGMGSHAGTHVDAPAHFSVSPTTVDELDPNVLIGPCKVIYLPEVAEITVDTLADHHLIGVERVLFRTRNSAHWASDVREFDPNFVSLAFDTAVLLSGLGVKLIGVDGLSIEKYGGTGEVHELLLSSGIVLLEGLNLHNIPPGNYRLITAPLRLQGADGAPARVFLEG